MARPASRTRRRFWVFLLAAYALVAAWTWQLAVVEIFEHHDELSECPDDGDGPCDDGVNCHCCLLCAHQVAPAVAPPPPELPRAVIGVIEESAQSEDRAPSPVHPAPPLKVPRHLA